MIKQILILVSVSLFVALITSGTCSGPIDQIFVGWRDSVGCSVGGGWNCFGINHLSNDYQRNSGALALVFLLFFTLFFYGLFRVTRWFWRKLGEE